MRTEERQAPAAVHAHKPVPDPKNLLPSAVTISVAGGPRVTTVYQKCGLCGRTYAWR